MSKRKRPQTVCTMYYRCQCCGRKKRTTTLTRAGREELCSCCKRFIRRLEETAGGRL